MVVFGLTKVSLKSPWFPQGFELDVGLVFLKIGLGPNAPGRLQFPFGFKQLIRSNTEYS